MVHSYPDKERTAQNSNLQRSSCDLFGIWFICTGNSFQTMQTYHYHLRILLGNFFQKKKIQWTAAQEISFQNLKKAATASPIFKLLNLSQVFILQTNASDRGFGAFLLQEDLDKNNQPISYISRKLNKAE